MKMKILQSEYCGQLYARVPSLLFVYGKGSQYRGNMKV